MRNTIDVTDRLTDGAKAVVMQRSAIRAILAGQTSWEPQDDPLRGDPTDPEVLTLIASFHVQHDVWSGNPNTDRIAAQDATYARRLNHSKIYRRS